MLERRNRVRFGFSLIELVIVVVIMGIIAAIAIPRLSRGSGNAADAALSGDLAVLRNAVELYATEHNNDYPKLATIENQLTLYSNAKGETSATKDNTNYMYGPYLRKLPPLPVGPTDRKGNSKVVGPPATIGAGDGGWFYNETTGDVKANLADTEVDKAGTKYNTY